MPNCAETVWKRELNWQVAKLATANGATPGISLKDDNEVFIKYKSLQKSVRFVGLYFISC